MKNKRKQLPNKGSNNKAEEPKLVKVPESPSDGSISINDKLPNTIEQDSKVKAKKDPGEPLRDLEEKSDHVSALLNRRKKWK